MGNNSPDIGEPFIVLDSHPDIENASIAEKIIPIEPRNTNISLEEQLTEASAKYSHYKDVPATFTVIPNSSNPDGPGTVAKIEDAGGAVGNNPFLSHENGANGEETIEQISD